MELRQLNALEAGRRVYDFLTTTPPPPPLTNMDASFTQIVQNLGALIATVDASASVQIPGTTKSQLAARNAAATELCSAYLRPLRRIAKIILRSNAGAPLSPAFPDMIHIPETHNHQAIVASANAVVQSILPYQDLFIAHGMPATFLDQLTTVTNTLVQTAHVQRTTKSSQIAATADIVRLLKQMRDMIHLLDVNVVHQCRNDKDNGPATAAAWSSAKRIHLTTVAQPKKEQLPEIHASVAPST